MIISDLDWKLRFIKAQRRHLTKNGIRIDISKFIMNIFLCHGTWVKVSYRANYIVLGNKDDF